MEPRAAYQDLNRIKEFEKINAERTKLTKNLDSWGKQRTLSKDNQTQKIRGDKKCMKTSTYLSKMVHGAYQHLWSQLEINLMNQKTWVEHKEVKDKTGRKSRKHQKDIRQSIYLRDTRRRWIWHRSWGKFLKEHNERLKN